MILSPYATSHEKFSRPLHNESRLPERRLPSPAQLQHLPLPCWVSEARILSGKQESCPATLAHCATRCQCHLAVVAASQRQRRHRRSQRPFVQAEFLNAGSSAGGQWPVHRQRRVHQLLLVDRGESMCLCFKKTQESHRAPAHKRSKRRLRATIEMRALLAACTAESR